MQKFEDLIFYPANIDGHINIYHFLNFAIFNKGRHGVHGWSN